MREIGLRKPRLIVGMLAVGCLAGVQRLGLAEPPAALCSRVRTDDELRAIPSELVPAVNAVLGTSMPAREVIAAAVFRCDQGHVMVCATGANRSCGPANARPIPRRGLVQWCHDNPDAAMVPAVASGHDTIYAWRCRAGAAHIARRVLTRDARGFIAEFLRVLQ